MNEQEVRKLFKEVMDKEAERNTKDKSRSHPYSEICSCERCHTASILVASIKSFEPKVEQFVCPTCHRESDSGVLLLKKEPKSEKEIWNIIETKMIKWLKELELSI